MNTFQNVVIFSVDRNQVPMSVNDAAREYAIEQLNAFCMDYSIGVGRHNGVDEQCYVVILPNSGREHYLEMLKSMATEAKQESMLNIDSNGRAFLLYLDTGATDELGRLEEVSKERALAKDAYTNVNGRYYITKE